MIQKLTLEHFKNFEQAQLALGSLTTLIGSNATGKSNLRDAFRFLHGIGRGYLLAEILGEKYSEGGYLEWRGLRGGTREITYFGSQRFTVTVELATQSNTAYIYSIQVEPGDQRTKPRVVTESLFMNQRMVYEAHLKEATTPQNGAAHLLVHSSHYDQDGRFINEINLEMRSDQPVLHQAALSQETRFFGDINIFFKTLLLEVELTFLNMRFFTFHPDAMRIPSLPGQTVLGDRGENLSSVLQTICEKQEYKQALLVWLRELTPMDVIDLDFVADQTGRILVNLTERDGHRLSAYSASDGTLRFLAVLAALLGPKVTDDTSQVPRFYFFEELENGLHPTRLQLLLQLLEQETGTGEIQVVTTTHSPQLLQALSPAAREHASLIYRLPETPTGYIKQIMELPEIQRILTHQNLALLHESGWFEDIVNFLENAPSNEMAVAL